MFYIKHIFKLYLIHKKAVCMQLKKFISKIYWWVGNFSLYKNVKRIKKKSQPYIEQE